MKSIGKKHIFYGLLLVGSIGFFIADRIRPQSADAMTTADTDAVSLDSLEQLVQNLSDFTTTLDEHMACDAGRNADVSTDDLRDNKARDPFVPDRDFIHAAEVSRQDDQRTRVENKQIIDKLASYTLTAILRDGQNAHAVISGQIVPLGSQVEECTLVGLSDESAIFRKDGIEVRIYLDGTVELVMDE